MKVIAPKKVKKLPSFIPEQGFVEHLDRQLKSEDFDTVRDQLVLEMLYATGIRLSELIELKTSQVDVYNQQLKVLGKRNKERIIPFASELRKLIDFYQVLKERQNIVQGDYFFVRNSGIKLYPKYVYNLVHKHLSEISSQQKRSPHVLRHTFATHMLNNGADLNAIKELLGHSSLASTQVYTHNSIEKLKLTYKQAHPKA
jgi:integrase/recombinase XerC